jgi:ribose transport system substrate-binding protein
VKPIKALLALITNENDYQRAQAAAAEAVSRTHNLSLEIVYAGGDAVLQTQQILNAIQKRNHGIDVVVTQPAGTGMVHVAEEATKAGIGWGLLSREVDYIQRLRLQYSSAPAYEVNVDQLEIGRIQAAQVATVLPHGGTVLYICGPASGSSSKLRLEGLMSSKPTNLELKTLRGQWTEESAYHAVHSWLKLSTSKSAGFVGVVSQNDAMALGARRAFSEIGAADERESWLRMPFFGCDGLPETGQQYVKRGFLVATAVSPTTAGTALELFAKFKSEGKRIPERTLVRPSSHPPLANLHPKVAMTAASSSRS